MFLFTVYAQILKQLTDNPNQASFLRYWSLLLVCLGFFAPGEILDNYVHTHIRSLCPAHLKAALTQAAHQSIYRECGRDAPGTVPRATNRGSATPPNGDDVPRLLAAAGVGDGQGSIRDSLNRRK